MDDRELWVRIVEAALDAGFVSYVEGGQVMAFEIADVALKRAPVDAGDEREHSGETMVVHTYDGTKR